MNFDSNSETSDLEIIPPSDFANTLPITPPIYSSPSPTFSIESGHSTYSILNFHIQKSAIIMSKGQPSARKGTGSKKQPQDLLNQDIFGDNNNN